MSILQLRYHIPENGMWLKQSVGIIHDRSPKKNLKQIPKWTRFPQLVRCCKMGCGTQWRDNSRQKSQKNWNFFPNCLYEGSVERRIFDCLFDFVITRRSPESNLSVWFSEVSLIRDNHGKETVWLSKNLIIKEWKPWLSRLSPRLSKYSNSPDDG